MSQSRTEIRLSNESDRWRYVCPRGHTSWEPTNFHFWCAACARHHGDTEPEFDYLHDRKTGAEIERERIVLEPGEGDTERGAA